MPVVDEKIGYARELLGTMLRVMELPQYERSAVLSFVRVEISKLFGDPGLALVDLCELFGIREGIASISDGIGIRVSALLKERFPDVDESEIDQQRLPFRLHNSAFLPTDDGEIKPGDGSFEAPRIFPRGKLIVEVLEELGLDIETCHGHIGINSKDMYRTLSYRAVVVPGLDRIILYCDEEDNRTFVVYEHEDFERYVQLRKSELRDEKKVDSIIWDNNHQFWKEKLKLMLLRGEPRAQNRPESDDFRYEVNADGTFTVDGVTCASVNGFYKLPGVQISPNSLRALIEYYGVEPVLEIRPPRSKCSVDIYDLAELNRLIPKFQENGDLILLGTVYTSITSFAEQNGFSRRKMRQLMENKGLVSHPVLAYGRGDFYVKSDLEGVMPPVVDEDGFVEIDGRIAVGLKRAYAAGRIKYNPRHMREKMIERGFKPIVGVVVVSKDHCALPKEFFWADELEQI